MHTFMFDLCEMRCMGITMDLIENINFTSFKKFGSIESKYSNNMEYKYAEHTVNIKKIDTLFVYDYSVIMDIISGIALLYVTTSITEEGSFFLLDKPVTIKAGILFNVISLYGSCSIKLGYTDSGHTLRSPFQIVGPLGLTSNINISRIHTLFYQDKEKGFVFKGEAHDFWELTYVDKGKLYTKIEDKVLLLEQGDTIFYSPGQHHTQWCEEDRSVSFITITFDMYLDDTSLLDKIHCIDFDIKTLLSKIITEKENNSVYSDDLILCYLKEFIIRLIRNSCLEKTITRQENMIKARINDTIINRCLDFIANNYDKKITVPDVARNIPISVSYLSSIFSKKLNTTVVNYINNYKLERSKELIKTSNMNFTQISEMLGYNSVHYFSKQFKDKYGISPSEYAKSIKR